MPTVSRFLDPSDLEELSLCETSPKILNSPDKIAKSSVETKLQIEVDTPEPLSEPEYFLEKWPPERHFIPDIPIKTSLPQVTSLPRYVIDTPQPTLVTRLNKQVKRPLDSIPIKAFYP